ncbi:MAG: NIPSNAP family protein [Candidatus Dormibacteraeota bacterium]|nr:NIPSNAP family protein [Candidatus Dormibacteraeota bacterium]
MADSSVFELRTYHAAPGRLADLEARFRDHTIALFQKHGIEVVGFWRALDEPDSRNVLIYVLRYPSRQVADERWSAFQSDPEWIEVKSRTEVNGRLAPQIESVFMESTDFSPLR